MTTRTRERNGAEQIVVLSSRRAFEALVGPVPEAARARHVFFKPERGARIGSALAGARLVVSQSYLRPELNRWIFAARRRSVPTLLLIDGPLEWANLHANPSLARRGAEGARALYDPIVHDAVAAIGEAQALALAHRNAGRGIVFKTYANRRIRTEAPATDRNDAARFDFLLTTARTAAFHAHDREALRTALCACAEALERAGYATLVRIFDEPIRAAVRAAAPHAHFDATGRFTDALAQTRCVIGTPSSVLLEAMHHDRPTATLVFRDGPLFDRTGWLLGGFGDWHASFASMLARDPERMSIQRDALQASLSDRDYFAAIEDLCAGEALTAPRPLDALDLEFEHHVLRAARPLRARLLAPVYRALRRLRGERDPED